MTVQNLMKQGHEVLVATPGKNAPSEYPLHLFSPLLFSSPPSFLLLSFFYHQRYYGAKVVKVPGFSFPLNDVSILFIFSIPDVDSKKCMFFFSSVILNI